MEQINDYFLFCNYIDGLYDFALNAAENPTPYRLHIDLLEKSLKKCKDDWLETDGLACQVITYCRTHIEGPASVKTYLLFLSNYIEEREERIDRCKIDLYAADALPERVEVFCREALIFLHTIRMDIDIIRKTFSTLWQG